MTDYPTVTPALEGSRYCVECAFMGKHPERTDDRIYIIRFSDQRFDSKSLCRPHAKEQGYISEE